MGSSSSNGRAAPAPPPPLHVMDADEEDENVKQLSECAALYLSLQAPILSRSLSPLPPLRVLFPASFLDCLVESNRNWKACQAPSN
uniref:Uncharacterized protein n=1 Tax=Oryza barthii TaxID=65489 RepID=A0A0D3G7G6_9ORYZ